MLSPAMTTPSRSTIPWPMPMSVKEPSTIGSSATARPSNVTNRPPTSSPRSTFPRFTPSNEPALPVVHRENLRRHKRARRLLDPRPRIGHVIIADGDPNLYLVRNCPRKINVLESNLKGATLAVELRRNHHIRGCPGSYHRLRTDRAVAKLPAFVRRPDRQRQRSRWITHRQRHNIIATKHPVRSADKRKFAGHVEDVAPRLATVLHHTLERRNHHRRRRAPRQKRQAERLRVKTMRTVPHTNDQIDHTGESHVGAKPYPDSIRNPSRCRNNRGHDVRQIGRASCRERV